jgi:hypothetical protein
MIDLINWSEGCRFQGFGDEETLWKAELEQTASNGFKVALFWDFEGGSACGSCVHDFSIRGERVAIADDELDLIVATRSCTDPMCTWSETSDASMAEKAYGVATSTGGVVSSCSREIAVGGSMSVAARPVAVLSARWGFQKFDR